MTEEIDYHRESKDLLFLGSDPSNGFIFSLFVESALLYKEDPVI